MNLFVKVNRNSYRPMMAKIDEFWKKNDYMNLTKLTDMSEFACLIGMKMKNLFQYFYHNLGFDDESFKNTKAYKTFREVTSKNSEYAVKHKTLNDLNKVFVNDYNFN